MILRIPDLQNKQPVLEKVRSVCLIVEGYEEEYYFNKLLTLDVFSTVYRIKIINAKTASNIPARYEEAYQSNSYSIVLVVCDRDRIPRQYDYILKKIDETLGPGRAKHIIIFTNPCTLQVILSHFEDVSLSTQAKKEVRELVEKLTGIVGYDAHQDQLKIICDKINRTNWQDMLKRLATLSVNPDVIPSSNMHQLFANLRSDDIKWITDLNSKIQS